MLQLIMEIFHIVPLVIALAKFGAPDFMMSWDPCIKMVVVVFKGGKGSASPHTSRLIIGLAASPPILNVQRIRDSYIWLPSAMEGPTLV